jgi:hypothetical protein
MTGGAAFLSAAEPRDERAGLPRNLAAALALAALLGPLAACYSDDREPATIPEAATNPGASSGGAFTVGMYCNQIISPICDRIIACRLYAADNKLVCQTQIQENCCGNRGDCHVSFPESGEAEVKKAIADCAAAMPTFDCAELDAGNLPSVCTSN